MRTARYELMTIDAMCTSGKACYSSRAKARRAARSITRERGVTLDVYVCPDCENWHLTRTIQRRPR